MDNSSNYTGNSQNHNCYSYALNNPLKYTDPSGYAPAPILWENRGANAVNSYALAWYNQNNPGGYGNHLWPHGTYGFTGYYYDWDNGKYYSNATGKEVSFNEVFDNYIVPNSTFRWKRSDANNQKERQGIEEEVPRNENVAWDPNTWVETVGMSFDPWDEGQNQEVVLKNSMAGKWDWNELSNDERAQVVVDNLREWDYGGTEDPRTWKLPTLKDFFYNIESKVSLDFWGNVKIYDREIGIHISGRISAPFGAPQIKYNSAKFGSEGYVDFAVFKYSGVLYISTFIENEVYVENWLSGWQIK